MKWKELTIMGDVDKGLYTEFLDAEGDLFRVNFHYDGCAHIDTSEMAYIFIPAETLFKLSELVYKADEIYRETFEKELV